MPSWVIVIIVLPILGNGIHSDTKRAAISAASSSYYISPMPSADVIATWLVAVPLDTSPVRMLYTFLQRGMIQICLRLVCSYQNKRINGG